MQNKDNVKQLNYTLKHQIRDRNFPFFSQKNDGSRNSSKYAIKVKGVGVRGINSIQIFIKCPHCESYFIPKVKYFTELICAPNCTPTAIS